MKTITYGVYIAPLKDKSAFKIGKSKKPLDRLKQLSRFYDFDIDKIIIIDCQTEKFSFEIESILHKILDRFNLILEFDGGTEFFDYEKYNECLDSIKILCKLHSLSTSNAYIPKEEIVKASSAECVAMRISNRIKNKRISLNLRQIDLAKSAGLGLRTVQRLESYGNCDLTNLIKISSVLGIENEIFSIKTENNPRKRVYVGPSDHEPDDPLWIDP